MFSQLQYLLREEFQFSRAGYQRVDLAGQHVAREVRVDRLDHLIVVVSHAGNLGDILVQPDEVALFRGVGPDHAERLVEDSPDDEAAAVVLQARPSQHLLEADMLLLGQLEVVPMNLRIGRTRPADLSFNLSHNPDSYLAFNISGGRSPAGRAPLSDKRRFVGQRYSSLFPQREQDAALRIARFLHRKSYADHSGDTRFSRCNITTPQRERQTLRTASGGQERPADSGTTKAYYLAAGSTKERMRDRPPPCFRPCEPTRPIRREHFPTNS